MDYRLYFLRGDGRIERARNLRCADDAEAIRLLLDHPRSRTLELWHGARRLRALPAIAAVPGAPPDYVVYLLRGEMIVGLTAFDTGNDVAALAIAMHIFQACDDECDAFEVWRGDYRVQARADSEDRSESWFADATPRRAANPCTGQLAALERHHQHLVVDRELRLYDSYEALHRSRKLLQRIGELKPLFGAFDSPA
jgi:hypothetical protein